MLTKKEEQRLLHLLWIDAKEECENRLSTFVKHAWEILEPGKDMLWNWHLDAICEHLECVLSGEILKLMINVPPRSFKSGLASVCFPTWTWIKHPERRFFCSSYSGALAVKHSLDRRDIIRSQWYQYNWADRFYMRQDQDQKTKFLNNKRGHMIATSVGGHGTGEGGDIIILDDLLNPKQAMSDTERKRANEYHSHTIPSRKDNKKTSAEIMIAQRLHEDDPCGQALRKQPDDWVLLKLPGQAQERIIIHFPRSKKQHVFEEGEYLHSAREGKKEHDNLKIELGPIEYPAQYLQNPQAGMKGFFPRKNWRHYIELPKDIFRIRQYIDTAEKPGITNDWSVITTIAESPSGFYWLDVWRDRVEYPELEAATISLYSRIWLPNLKVEKVKVEDKSSGIQLIQNLKRYTKLPIEPFQPGQRDKVVRASGVVPTVAAGNCYLPINAAWDVEGFIDEHLRFPFATHDDRVDTTSMGLEDLRNDELEIVPRIYCL